MLNKWTRNSPAALEGRALFDFLKAEDKGASEGCKQRLCCWFSLQGHQPGGRSSPVVSPASLSAAPQPACPAAGHSPCAHSICFQVLKLKPSCSKGQAGPESHRRGVPWVSSSRRGNLALKQSKAKPSAFSPLFAELMLSFACILTQISDNFLLEIRGREERQPSN